MKARRRLTREESKEVTRMRLIEAAEKLFVRKGFDEASVDEISEMAGYSRGAFYSNFEDKDDMFLALIDSRQPDVLEALDDILRRTPEPAERIAAVRDWLSNLWRFREFNALQMEFSRRAMRDRAVKKRLAEMRRKELETYALWVCRYMGTAQVGEGDRPEIVALALWAVVRGLATLAIDTDPEWEHMYTEAAMLAIQRICATRNSQLGEMQ